MGVDSDKVWTSLRSAYESVGVVVELEIVQVGDVADLGTLELAVDKVR